MSKHSPDQTIPPRIRITALCQVSKPRIDQSTKQAYYVASLDVFAYREGGQEIFEYFHLLTIQDRPSREFVEVQKRLRESLMTDLRKFVRTVEHDGRLAEGRGIT